jgi:type IV pilus assembly protein PilE
MNVALIGKYPRGSLGFSLIELLAVVTIVGILAAIAYPSYQQQIIRSRREAAEGELVQLASVQEKIYLNSNAYSGNVKGAYTGQSTGGLGKITGQTDDGKYNITVALQNVDQSYVLTATPVTGTSQAPDGNISISSDGTRRWGTKNW